MAKSNATAVVNEWVAQNKGRQLAWIRTTIQDLDREIATPVAKGGHMPVVTGNLRRSRLGSASSMPAIKKEKFAVDPGKQISVALLDLKIGGKFFYGFQAIYARRIEEIYGFLRLSIQRFPQIADAAAKKVHGRVTARLKNR